MPTAVLTDVTALRPTACHAGCPRHVAARAGSKALGWTSGGALGGHTGFAKLKVTLA